MKTLLVQDYLRSGKTYEELYSEHGVGVRPYKGKISVNYDMLEADRYNALACQCRGLILREGTFDIVAYPFNRFFNHGEGMEADIDWKSALVEEKLDGTLIIVYFDQIAEKWMCATRNVCEAHFQAHNTDMTFAQLVDFALERQFDTKGLNLKQFMHPFVSYRDKTFMFELTSPINRIICAYENFEMTLLGVRDNISFEEENPINYAKAFGVRTPRYYMLNNISDVISIVKEWSPLEHEGVVVKDKTFNRIKIKNPSYVAYNKILDRLSDGGGNRTNWRGCAEIVLMGKSDDVIPMMPEYIANRIRRLDGLISKMIHRINDDFKEIKDIEDKKEFALAAKNKFWPSAMFALKKGTSMQDFLYKKHLTPDDYSGIIDSALDSIVEKCFEIDLTAATEN